MKNQRMLYIGAVSLLCRVYGRLTPGAREDMEGEGSMEVLARDFNAQGFELRMERSVGGWALFDKAEGE